MTPNHTRGLHHVTAIANYGARNKDFYTRILGLRLVKKTVNFDMPNSYHLYYGNEKGAPGTLLTFFIWEGLPAGRTGRGQAARATFGVPSGSIPSWQSHLLANGIPASLESGPAGQTLVFKDCDGLDLGLQETDLLPPSEASRSAPSPVELMGVTLVVGEEPPTLELLQGMGYREILRDGNTLRLETKDPDPASPVRGRYLDLCISKDLPWARSGNGVIHHIAFRATSGAHQHTFLTQANLLGLNPSTVIDRCYFRSVYYRCPAGILFEVATDEPGFTVDEPAESLGTTLCLPPFLRSRQSEIEQALPPL